MLRADELQGQSAEDLKLLERDLSKEIFQLKNELYVTKKIEKPHLIREKKRDRAKVLTVLRAKQQNKA